jgi:diketogulonate reductase-like aldo/keto reductase
MRKIIEIDISQQVRLINGITIPRLGFGTYSFPPKDRILQALPIALNTGYRLIDTAMNYQNEHFIGQILKKSAIPRKELYLTSKVWKDVMRAKAVREAVEESLENLQTEYLDLLLIHRPLRDFNASTWEIMEDLYREGIIKAIGVSNFGIHQIEALKETSNLMPAVNQIELHPFYYRKELIEYCFQKQILVEAYSPIALSKRLDYPELVLLSQKYEKTPAQIMLRWSLQHQFVPIPRSLNPTHIRENFNVFDFEIALEDMEKIDSWNENFSVMKPDPDEY